VLVIEVLGLSRSKRYAFHWGGSYRLICPFKPVWSHHLCAGYSLYPRPVFSG